MTTVFPLPINPISQRDWRWRWTKLGFGNTTIGSYGCTITALTMQLGLTDPREVNNAIKQFNGFVGANRNLIVWSVLPKAFSKIKSVARYYGYDNEKVKALLSKGKGVLVEVDGTRIGASRHWVLYKGGGRMNDPWYGADMSTSYYPAVGYAAIEYYS